ncbi:hypothetical protein DFP72DRAFT_838493 [Ephemerocybe angulata]|uniref:DEAD/DEAH box helicase domain-containing protein n=1 Tax=Ephemerocybe angulata TaxID=980116 RepID=A0A8H6ME05_9AGAR|nr:hypothetical protein DFP72DRAFT_838493 [Tulosesus angulatus]
MPQPDFAFSDEDLQDLGHAELLDCLIDIGTSYGKTACMIMLAIWWKGKVMLVILPLKRLQVLQVLVFEKSGVNAVSINEDNAGIQRVPILEDTLHHIKRGDLMFSHGGKEIKNLLVDQRCGLEQLISRGCPTDRATGGSAFKQSTQRGAGAKELWDVHDIVRKNNDYLADEESMNSLAPKLPSPISTSPEGEPANSSPKSAPIPSLWSSPILPARSEGPIDRDLEAGTSEVTEPACDVGLEGPADGGPVAEEREQAVVEHKCKAFRGHALFYAYHMGKVYEYPYRTLCIMADKYCGNRFGEQLKVIAITSEDYDLDTNVNFAGHCPNLKTVIIILMCRDRGIATLKLPQSVDHIVIHILEFLPWQAEEEGLALLCQALYHISRRRPSCLETIVISGITHWGHSSGWLCWCISHDDSPSLQELEILSDLLTAGPIARMELKKRVAAVLNGKGLDADQTLCRMCAINTVMEGPVILQIKEEDDQTIEVPDDGPYNLHIGSRHITMLWNRDGCTIAIHESVSMSPLVLIFFADTTASMNYGLPTTQDCSLTKTDGLEWQTTLRAAYKSSIHAKTGTHMYSTA